MKSRNKNRMLLAAGLVGGAALSLAACSPSKVEVGVILPLTGEHGAYGVSIEKGIQLAYSEIEADQTNKSTITSFKIRDTQSDLGRAKLWTEKDAGGGAIAIIGGVTTAEAKVMIPIAEKEGAVLISPSASSPELSGVSKSFFRIWPSDQTEATKMAQSAFGELQVKTVMVVAGQEPYAQGAKNVFKSAFEAQGGQVLQTVDYPAGSRDLSGVAVQVIEAKPEAVFVADYADGIAELVRELRHHQFPGRILTTSAFSSAPAIEKIGQAAAGVIFAQTTFDPNSSQPEVKSFVAAFKTKFGGETPDIYAAYGYDALHVVARAARGQEISAAGLVAGLRSDAVKSYNGASGKIEFDDKGDVLKSPSLYTVGADLKIVPYDPAAAPPAAPAPADAPPAADAPAPAAAGG